MSKENHKCTILMRKEKKNNIILFDVVFVKIFSHAEHYGIENVFKTHIRKNIFKKLFFVVLPCL